MIPPLQTSIANLWGGFQFDGLAVGRYEVLVVGPAVWGHDFIEVGKRDAAIALNPWWEIP